MESPLPNATASDSSLFSSAFSIDVGRSEVTGFSLKTPVGMRNWPMVPSPTLLAGMAGSSPTIEKINTQRARTHNTKKVRHTVLAVAIHLINEVCNSLGVDGRDLPKKGSNGFARGSRNGAVSGAAGCGGSQLVPAQASSSWNEL
ncbi:hypothetical protein MRX96_039492 [Rhipicephalus microplus]